MSGSQYDLPGGAVGREFVDLLTSEVRLLIDNSAVSDRLMMYCPVMLQRNHMVRVGSDVRRLLKRRMEMWKKTVLKLCSVRLNGVLLSAAAGNPD